MSQTREDVQEMFAEGVRTTTEESWVSPHEIEDPTLRAHYESVRRAYDAYNEAAFAFDEAIYADGGE
jgi:hypothetical protein